MAAAIPRVDLPRVDLIPEEVGLGTVFTLAGAGATLGLLIDYRRGARDERWVRRGTLVGFIAGVVLLVGIAIARAGPVRRRAHRPGGQHGRARVE